MSQGWRHAFRVGFDRWGGLVLALLGASGLLRSIADIFTPDSLFWRLTELEGAWWAGVPFELISLAIYGLFLVVGLRWWRIGQREAAKRLPGLLRGNRLLRGCGVAVIVLAFAFLAYMISVMVRTETESPVPSQVFLLTRLVIEGLFIAAGVFRILWAKAGLSRHPRVSIAEGVFGICTGIVVICWWYRPFVFASYNQLLLMQLAGGVVALRSVADALLLLRPRQAADQTPSP